MAVCAIKQRAISLKHHSGTAHHTIRKPGRTAGVNETHDNHSAVQVVDSSMCAQAAHALRTSKKEPSKARVSGVDL
jgi:hypothetical protein